jgi:hypothetical protein
MAVTVAHAQTPTIAFLPPTSPASSFPQATPNPLLSNLTFYSNTTQYNLFKNTHFSALCPFQTSAPLAASGHKVQILDGWPVIMSQAKTQEEFCQHLSPDIEWIVIPTQTTPASYLPSWTSALVDLAWLGVQWLLLINSSSDVGWKTVPFLLWNCAQNIYWTWQMSTGTFLALGYPQSMQAPWLNPITWIPATSYIIRLGRAKVSFCITFPLFVWTFFNFIESFVCAILRFPPHNLGTGSYLPFLGGNFTLLNFLPTSPPSGQSGCYGLLSDPRYPLFSDPLSQSLRIMEVLYISLSFLLLPLSCMFGCKGDRDCLEWWRPNVLLWMGVFQIAATIWTGILASQGTPFMRDEHCGVVVVAMSPRFGYWDAHIHDIGYKHQIVRTVFGLCKSSTYIHRGFLYKTSSPGYQPLLWSRICIVQQGLELVCMTLIFIAISSFPHHTLPFCMSNSQHRFSFRFQCSQEGSGR